MRVHPDTVRSMLKLYLVIDRKNNRVTIKERKLLKVNPVTLRAQTHHWKLLYSLLKSCRDQILNGESFKPIIVPNLAKKTPEQIVAAIINS